MANTNDMASVIGTMVQKLSADSGLLDKFKQNPAGAISEILQGSGHSEAQVGAVKDALAGHGEGANLTSMLGSLGALFGSTHEEATANHEAAGNPLNALAGLLGGGGSTSGAGNILSLLGSVFGNSNGGGSSLGDIAGLLGKFMGK